MKAVLGRMVIGGRVALCGLIAGYNSGERPSDDFSPFIMKRLSMRGFLVLDYTKTKEAVGAIAGWIRAGKLKAEETVAEGLENAPVVLNRLFDGSHRGKLVLRVDREGCRPALAGGSTRRQATTSQFFCAACRARGSCRIMRRCRTETHRAWGIFRHRPLKQGRFVSP